MSNANEPAGPCCEIRSNDDWKRDLAINHNAPQTINHLGLTKRETTAISFMSALITTNAEFQFDEAAQLALEATNALFEALEDK